MSYVWSFQCFLYVCGYARLRTRKPLECQDFFSRILSFCGSTLKASFFELREPFLKPFGELSEPVGAFCFFGSKKVFADVDFSNPDSRDPSFRLSRHHFLPSYRGPEVLKHIKSIYFWKVLVLSFSKIYTFDRFQHLWGVFTEVASWVYFRKYESRCC